MLNDLILKVGVNYHLAGVDRNVDSDINKFGDTPVGKLIFMLLNVAGFLIIIFTIFNIVKGVMKSGSIGPEQFKKILGSALLVYFCFFPSTVITVVKAIGNIVKPATDSVNTTITETTK